jgi:hypothetical protein
MRSTVNQCSPSAGRGCDLTDAHRSRACPVGKGVFKPKRVGGRGADGGVLLNDEDPDGDNICLMVGALFGDGSDPSSGQLLILGRVGVKGDSRRSRDSRKLPVSWSVGLPPRLELEASLFDDVVAANVRLSLFGLGIEAFFLQADDVNVKKVSNFSTGQHAVHQSSASQGTARSMCTPHGPALRLGIACGGGRQQGK